MIPVDLTAAMAAEHRHDLEREAVTARLAALARRCSPRAWTRAGQRIVAAVSSGRHALSAGRGRTQTCCA